MVGFVWGRMGSSVEGGIVVEWVLVLLHGSMVVVYGGGVWW